MWLKRFATRELYKEMMFYILSFKMST